MGSIARQQILDMVRKVVLAEVGDEPVKVYLFGSWARGEERTSSDIDIAVESMEGACLDNWAHLRETLEESAIPYRIDIVNLAEAADELVKKVRKEGILWKG